MAAPLMALAIGSTALSVAGSIYSGFQQARQYRQQAMLNRIQAQEIVQRANINNDILFRNAKEFQGTQMAQIAASGSGLTGSSRALLDETLDLAEEQALRNLREAKFEASMKQMTATFNEEDANSAIIAGILGGVGSAAKGGTAIYRASGNVATLGDK